MPGSRHIALFMGAGVSKTVGYPLTNEILPRLYRRLLQKTLFGPKPENQTDCEALAGFLSDLMPGLEGAEGEQLPLITDVLSLVDEMIVSKHVPVVRTSDSDLVRLRLLLDRAIFRVLKCPYDDKKPRQVPAILRQLVDPIVSACRAGSLRASIVSTNYDIAVERRVYQKLGYGGTERGSGIAPLVDFGLSWRDVVDEGVVHHRPSRAELSVFKLHGSMNWLSCGLCGLIYINPKGTIYHQAFRRKIDRFNTCDCGHAPLRPVIVSPSLVRDVREANLLAVWRAALEDLRTADAWILIGYSLPAEDISIRSLLVRAGNGHRSKDGPEVAVVQDGDSARPRYELFFPDCEYWSEGLESALSSDFLAEWIGV